MNSLKESSDQTHYVYRDLHTAGGKVLEQLKPLVADGAEIAAYPELDTAAIEAVENPGAKDKDKEKDDKGKKGKSGK